MSDRVGRRKLAVTGCLIAALMTLACSLTTLIGVLLALSAIFGAGLSCYWPSIIAWLGEGLAGHALARRLTTFGVAWNIGLLIGYYGSGVLFEHGSRLPFYTSAGAMLLIAILLSLPARTVPVEPKFGSQDGIVEIPKGRGFRKTAWLANFATNFSVGGTTALFPQLATHLGIGADMHGGLLAAGRAAALITFAALQFFMFWRTRLWPLWIAQLACAASIVWIGLAHATWMFAAAWIIGGAVSGYTYQASIYFTLEEMTEKGKGSGFHEAMVGSGMCLGPLLAGWVGSGYGLRIPYFFCATMQIALVALQLMVVWTQRQVTAKATA